MQCDKRLWWGRRGQLGSVDCDLYTWSKQIVVVTDFANARQSRGGSHMLAAGLKVKKEIPIQ
jgi:hypothetical protein